MANILRVELELQQRKSRLRGMPYYFFIDVCNLCNLRCPLCPTGLGTLERHQGMMTMEEYREILRRVKDYALVISLYNLGEPFLNKHLLDMVSHTAQNNIATILSSNFNWPIPVDPKDIVRSGLEYVTVSLDGVSQESYQRYRVKGEIAEVINNMRGLVDARKQLRARTPFVEWQFIVFKHNEHEISKAQRLAAQWGVDLLRFVSPTIAPNQMHVPGIAEQWMPRNPLFWEYHPATAERRGYMRQDHCFYLYRSMTIDPGGAVTPCCFAREQRHDFGNILNEDLNTIWNNKHYQSARALFADNPPAWHRVEVLCDSCELFKKGRWCSRSRQSTVGPRSAPN